MNPGVVEMPAGARAVKVVDCASGPLSETNPASVNLAVSLVDGQQIMAGTKTLPAGMAEGEANVPDGSGTGATGAAGPGGSDGKININTASVIQLEGLPGIGPTTMTKAIDFREKGGAFAGIDALEEAPGIGPAKIEVLRNAVTV